MSGGPHFFPDDVLPASGAIPKAQVDARLVQIKKWFNHFQSSLGQSAGYLDAHTLRFSADGAERVNSSYWELMHGTVKKRIAPSAVNNSIRADRHKICSLMELMLVHEQPIEHDDPIKRDYWNARLAYFCALCIIGNWDGRSLTNLHISESFQREHLAWLENTATNEHVPIFSNSATWYLAELILLRKNGIAI